MRSRLLSPSFILLLCLFTLPAEPVQGQDRVMLQGFYWDVTPGGVWYDTLTTRAARLSWAGFDAVWLPPVSKGAASQWDVGYTPYDYYDLGQYDSCGGNSTQGQGGCIPTRYGTRGGLTEAIQTLKSHGLDVYADIVLNHRSGGSLEPNQYGQYYSWGGGSLYSENGQTYTAFPLTHGSGRIAWAAGAGNEFFYPNASNNPGNTGDFYSESQLAGFHRMYTNTFAYDNALHNGFGQNLPLGDSLMAWGDWLTTELGLDGYRFDFVKGIHPEYLKRWVDHGAMRGKFHVHELYDGDINRLKTYHNQLSGSAQAPAIFDFNLRFAYKDVLDGGAPIYRWQEAGLINQFGFPFESIVTFVDNHDFDRINHAGEIAQDDHNPVVNNKMLAYAHMLTHPGYATVWWRDYFNYGLGGQIDQLIRIRKAFASGAYFALTRGDTGSPFWPGTNPANPWEHLYVGQRNGDGTGRGLIVAINKHPNQWAEVWVTQQNGAWNNTTLKDLTGNGGGGTTQVFGDGRVRLWAPPNSYTVWVPESYQLAAAPPMPQPDAPAYHAINHANLQWPAQADLAAGDAETFYARIYAHGRTNAAGSYSGVEAWIGYSTQNTDPATWTQWLPASYHDDRDHADEYQAALQLDTGTYYVASRFRLDGQPFQYGGYSTTGGDFWDGIEHTSAVLTVTGTYSISGTVTAPSGVDASGVTLALVRDGAPAGENPVFATSDEQGAYVFSDVEAGAYTVSASRSGFDFGASATRSIVVDGADVSNLDFAASLSPVMITTISGPESPVAAGSAVQMSAAFEAAPALGPFSATWTWGDGTTSEGTVEDGVVTGNWTYGVPGVYTVTLSVRGAALGNTGDAAFRYVIVYDPSAGFVTGGGWIDSPPGAYSPNPAMTGKASFGFVSGYKKGATVPDGNTRFQFDAAGFSFKSTSYEWLVIAGARGQYKGTGTVGNTGDYGFMLTAVDGQMPGGGDQDRFRIKIWDRATSVIVYDNKMGAADDSDATALGGGSIVIHTKGSRSNFMADTEEPVLQGLPVAFTLSAPYPNPFSTHTRLRFGMPETGKATLAVFDALGREVARLADGELSAGWHEATFNAAGLPSGVYFAQFVSGTYRQTQRLVLMR